MQPSDIKAESFARYPKAARLVALQNISVISRLPIVFAIVLLRELRQYGWRFPAEQQAIDSQFLWLSRLTADGFLEVLRAFSKITLDDTLLSSSWIEDPQHASEEMTAYLWSSHQIDAFHAAASNYARQWREAIPEQAPAQPRLCMVILARDLKAPRYTLFRKLRPLGTYYSTVDLERDGETISQVLRSRAASHHANYSHWLITSDVSRPGLTPSLGQDSTTISWEETASLRANILRRMQEVMGNSSGGPEQLRTLLATMSPSDLGIGSEKDDLITHFKLDLFTEGSGTQIFSTTFAQWTAREALRRAQPSTLVVRYGLRQRQLPMDQLIAGAPEQVSDPAGSLIDADMGAFYTWINLQRLSGSDESRFVAWSEATNEAIAIGPQNQKNSKIEARTHLSRLLGT